VRNCVLEKLCNRHVMVVEKRRVFQIWHQSYVRNNQTSDLQDCKLIVCNEGENIFILVLKNKNKNMQNVTYESRIGTYRA
jgi:hypothetical protein